ncbi:MAG: anion permease [Candidatus Azosocius agrarius]|nr:MAG: anion permease [Gammaproteobacteria bacterium]
MSSNVTSEKTLSGYKWNGAKPIPFFVVLFIFAGLWFVDVPSGLNIKSWHLFVIFLSTIIGLIIKPLPMGAMAIFAVCACTLTNTLPLGQVLSSFGSAIVWLIVSAFLLARGFIKTGLGCRIAYYFITFLGKSTLGLAYGLTITELLFAPGTPSNTARGAGIVFPIINGLNAEYKSNVKDGTQRRLGSYLIKLLFQVNVITSAMFVTATAGNPLVVSIVASHGIQLDWGTWALACSVPGIINLILLPFLLYIIFPPEIKSTPQAPSFAREKLKQLGPMSVNEIIMMFVFVFLLTLWIFGEKYGINATTAGITGLFILLVCGVLNWDDIIKEQNAWDTFIWMAVLIMLSMKLSDLGVTDWFGNFVKTLVVGKSWIIVLTIIGLLYYYAHYMFASMTAHISALYATFFVVCLTAGAPPIVTALLLGVASSLSAGLTHYGTGSAPVYFGSNYLTLSEWWFYGFIVSVINIIIWILFGGIWWKMLGYW